MFEELTFCAACSWELRRKASRWDCGVAEWRKQWFLLLCNAAEGCRLSSVHLGIYGALSWSSNCLQNKRCFRLGAPVFMGSYKEQGSW